MITSTVTVLLLIGLGAGGGAARADFVPNVTYYAPYPIWYPQYFGPTYSDYQVVRYLMPPAETAAMVKERLLAVNAANPAQLPPPKEALPARKPNKLPSSQE